MAEQMPPEALEQMKDVSRPVRAPIADLLDGDRVHLPFTVVHAHRVDWDHSLTAATGGGETNHGATKAHDGRIQRNGRVIARKHGLQTLET